MRYQASEKNGLASTIARQAAILSLCEDTRTKPDALL